ncbi:hypothetical protein ACS0TY_028181 [Phlomoides rotata]
MKSPSQIYHFFFLLRSDLFYEFTIFFWNVPEVVEIHRKKLLEAATAIGRCFEIKRENKIKSGMAIDPSAASSPEHELRSDVAPVHCAHLAAFPARHYMNPDYVEDDANQRLKCQFAEVFIWTFLWAVMIHLPWLRQGLWSKAMHMASEMTIFYTRIYRKANQAADILAKLHEDVIWCCHCPEFLLPHLYRDMNTEYFRFDGWFLFFVLEEFFFS